MNFRVVGKDNDLRRRWEETNLRLKSLDMLIRSEAEDLLTFGKALCQSKLLVNSSGRPRFNRVEGETLVSIKPISLAALAELLRSRQRTQEELMSMESELQFHADEKTKQAATSLIQ